MGSGKLKIAEARFTDTITGALRRIPFSDLNEPLYHFTDENGLYGILRTKSLWASLTTALDDTSEIAFALSRARRILESHELGCDTSFLDEVVALLDLKESQTIRTLGMKTYVVSFRTHTDERAHWAKYGHDGKGFALAFALKPLVIPGVLAIPVIYNSVEQDTLLRDFIEANAKVFADISKQCPREESWALRQRAIQFTALGLWVLSPLIKDPRFEEEREWRLIVTDLERVDVTYPKGLSREVQVRRSNDRGIPYKVLQYDALPIIGLELGVFATVEENDATLRHLLRQATLGREVPITRSHVPVGEEAD